MYLHTNSQRFYDIKDFYTKSDNSNSNVQTGGRLEPNSNRSSSPGPHSAEYLFNLALPPKEEGTDSVTDPLMQRFFQGEIPDESEHQIKIAEHCMQYGFPSALAWLFAKTKMTELTCGSKLGNLAPQTLVTALSYRGLSITSLVIERPSMSGCEFEDLTYLKHNDSLKKLDFSTSAMGPALFSFRDQIKGLNGQIVVTGGSPELANLASS